GWEIWTLALPADIARAAHLRLAQQVRGGADVDTAKLRSADTVRGTVEETTFKVRAACGALVLPRAAVASILFGSGERGLARVVLANGDTVTGFLENAGIAIAAGGCAGRRPSEHDPRAGARRGAPGEHGRIMTRPAPGGCPSNHGGCGERSGGCERRARSSLLRRAFRHASSVVAALAALAPRLVRL